MNLPILSFLSPLRTVIALLAGAALCGPFEACAGQDAADPGAIVRQVHAANIEGTVRALVGFGTRNTLSTQSDPKRGIGAAASWIETQFRALAPLSGGRLRVERQRFIQPVGPRVPEPTPITNIVATLPGDLPAGRERVIVVSGHYDSMCSSPTDAEHDAPGANDDASGVAAVLEIARVMAPYHFPATLVFMAVAGEEQGLLGATYFAEQARKTGVPIEAMFTNDIIGNSVGGNGVRDRHSVRVFSEGIAATESEAEARTRRSVGGEEDSPSRQIARYIRDAALRWTPGFRVTLVARRDRYLRGGDHIPFNEQGYAAVRFTEPNENYQHQHQNVRTEAGVLYGDLPQFVDMEYIARVAMVNAAAMAEMALAPAPPAKVGLVTARLTNDTELRWAADSDPDIAGYEIVWRPTTSPYWSKTRFVGRDSHAVVKGLSKDDYFFGVRTVSRSGHRSPVAFPKPVR